MPTVSAAPTTRSTASRSNAVPSPSPAKSDQSPTVQGARPAPDPAYCGELFRSPPRALPILPRGCNIIADDPPALGDDIRPRCAARFVLPGPAFQPVIERRRT